MQALVLLAVLILTGCGRYEVPISVGESRSTDPIVVDPAVVSRICQALSQKVPNSLVNTQAAFTISRKGCDDKKLSVPFDITTTIQNSLNGYTFVQSSGIVPFFGEIETTDKGTMSPVCTQLATGTLTSPVANNNEFIFFNTSSVNPEECSPRSGNEVCILIEKASGSGTNTATVHTKEWIRFNLDTTQGKAGFFTLKKQITSTSCAEGKTLINTSILK
jgi:hypothetical protein